MLAGNVELVVQASFNSSFMRHALEAHPSVLLGQVGAAGGGEGEGGGGGQGT